MSLSAYSKQILSGSMCKQQSSNEETGNILLLLLSSLLLGSISFDQHYYLPLSYSTALHLLCVLAM